MTQKKGLTSDGYVNPAPKHLAKSQKKLIRFQRQFSIKPEALRFHCPADEGLSPAYTSLPTETVFD